MFCGKTNLGKLERLQERALSTKFLTKSLSYNELLKKSGLLSVKMNLMRFLKIEVFKCVRGNNPSYLNDMFIAPTSNYDFLNSSRLLQPKHLQTMDINLSDTLAPKFGICSQRS